MSLKYVFFWLLVICVPGFGAEERFSGFKSGDLDFLGVIHYQGGFQRELRTKVESKSIVKYFRVDVPAYCGSVEVLQAFSYSEGVKVTANPVSGTSNLFSVMGGTGLFIGEIGLTLNGPVGSDCTIPIFSRESVALVGEIGSYVNSDVRLCNKYGRDIRIALAYYGSRGWVTQGWKDAMPGECFRPITLERITGTFYTYAYSVESYPRQWGTQQYFCVSSASPFVVTRSECDQGLPGMQWHQFATHSAPTGGSILTITYR